MFSEGNRDANSSSPSGSPSPGWGGLAVFFAHPTLIALAIATSWKVILRDLPPVSSRACAFLADLFRRREGRWREDLVADACDDGSIALAVVADIVPSRIILECRPPRLAICQRLPREYVGQLVAGFPDEGRPEADGTDAVPFPDGKKLVSKAG
jgi:hypothetical protein